MNTADYIFVALHDVLRKLLLTGTLAGKKRRAGRNGHFR